MTPAPCIRASTAAASTARSRKRPGGSSRPPFATSVSLSAAESRITRPSRTTRSGTSATASPSRAAMRASRSSTAAAAVPQGALSMRQLCRVSRSKAVWRSMPSRAPAGNRRRRFHQPAAGTACPPAGAAAPDRSVMPRPSICGPVCLSAVPSCAVCAPFRRVACRRPPARHIIIAGPRRAAERLCFLPAAGAVRPAVRPARAGPAGGRRSSRHRRTA